MYKIDTTLNHETFANCLVHCIDEAIKAPIERRAQLWLMFAIRDIKMCLYYYRRGN